MRHVCGSVRRSPFGAWLVIVWAIDLNDERSSWERAEAAASLAKARAAARHLCSFFGYTDVRLRADRDQPARGYHITARPASKRAA